MPEFAGADWIREGARLPMSELGAKVADILGAAYRGIYHMPRGAIAKANWADPNCVRVYVYDHDLATFDSDILTTLVVLCHDQCVRLAISGHNPHRARLEFSARKGRDGSSSTRHPTIESAIERARMVAK